MEHKNWNAVRFGEIRTIQQYERITFLFVMFTYIQPSMVNNVKLSDFRQVRISDINIVR